MSNLQKCGIKAEELEDGFVITGGTPNSAIIEPSGDHRIAMSFAIAGGLADGDTEITGAECVNISYPSFYNDLYNLTK